jgi:hypothetical protein
MRTCTAGKTRKSAWHVHSDPSSASVRHSSGMDAQQPAGWSSHCAVTVSSASLQRTLSGAAGTKDVGDSMHCPAAVRSCNRNSAGLPRSDDCSYTSPSPLGTTMGLPKRSRAVTLRAYVSGECSTHGCADVPACPAAHSSYAVCEGEGQG